jgi:hypothetical protein
LVSHEPTSSESDDTDDQWSTYTPVPLLGDDLAIIVPAVAIVVAVVIATSTLLVTSAGPLIIIAIVVIVIPAARRLGRSRAILSVAVRVRHSAVATPPLLEAGVYWADGVVTLVFVCGGDAIGLQRLALEAIVALCAAPWLVAFRTW